jgi:hypothetical protein
MYKEDTMVIDMDAVFEGAVKGEAILESRKAEEAVVGNGLPIINITYVIVDSQPQGDKGLSANGEMVYHTIWLPQDADDADKKARKIKGIKNFMKKHGLETDGAIDTKELADYLNQNRIQVGALLDVDEWRLENRGDEVTAVKRFFNV